MEKTNEKISIDYIHFNAWNYLALQLGNINAVAGVMGYFQARTGFNSNFGFEFEFGKIIDKEPFVHDKKEYGIGAWNKWNEKLSWWNLSKISGHDITSLYSQLDFFCDELKGITYKKLNEVLINSDNPEEAARSMYSLYSNKNNQNEMDLSSIVEYSHIFYNYFVRPKHIVRYVQIIDDEAWVKASPRFLAKKICKVHKGETYQLITKKKDGKWHSIYFEGEIRWIQASSSEIIEREETYGWNKNTFSE